MGIGFQQECSSGRTAVRLEVGCWKQAVPWERSSDVGEDRAVDRSSRLHFLVDLFVDVSISC